MDEPTSAPMIADRPLYLDAAGTSIVEDSPEARTDGRVLAWRGGGIPDAEVQRLGLRLVDGRVVQGDAPAEAPAPDDAAPAEPAPDSDPATGGE